MIAARRRGFVLALAILFAGTAAWAQGEASAEQFLRDLYQPYELGKAPNPTGRVAPALFSPGLLALIRRDQSLAQGEVGTLDHDPICSCQDYDTLKMVRIAVQPGSERTGATVSFVNGSTPVTLRFDLVKLSEGWRIDDMREPDIPSLRSFIEEGLARHR